VLLIVLIICFSAIHQGKNSIGDYFLFTGMLFVFMAPVQELVNFGGVFQSGKVAVSRLNQVLISDNEQSGQLQFDGVENKIEFRNVLLSFGKKEPVINNISFSILQGSDVAIVGESGSGKSTLAQLLLRLFLPESGEILIDGTNILNYEIRSLREKIGFISQDIFLFSDSVRNNMDPYHLHSDEEIQSLLLKLKLDKFKDNLQYHIGENGNKLSGGERQRMALGRLLLRKCNVYVFDEITSQIDPETESVLLDVIKEIHKESPEITMITISHRISNIIKKDEILFIDRGIIKAKGNHESLLDSSKEYAELFCVEKKV
jgi:ABC-type multidrug transport system fused ATPase/permease subunit